MLLCPISFSSPFRIPPWSSSTLTVTQCRLSPYVTHKYHASGLLLANHTNISTVFGEIVTQHDTMYRRKGGFLPIPSRPFSPFLSAMLHQYEKENADTLRQMETGRQEIEELINLYEEATTPDFMGGFDGEDEQDLSERNSAATDIVSPFA